MTRFARIGQAHVAYETWGEGPPDLLYFEEIPVDMLEDEPRLARWINRMSSIGRLIAFNPRGLGLSDPLGRAGAPSMDERLEDAIAVLDAVGCERAHLLGLAFTAHAAIDLAARRPDRTESLVLCNARAKWAWSEDYPHGMSVDLANTLPQRIVDPESDLPAPPGGPAPSIENDPAFQRWWERAGHRRASPATASAVMRHRLELDLRPALEHIRCPTLVIQRTDVEIMRGVFGSAVGHGRYLADHIEGAKLVELPGEDMLWWVGPGADAIVDEIELFVTEGAPRKTRRMLATVLFVDVVGSTERAVDMGDRRWREVLETYNSAVSSAAGRCGGRLVGTEGDGALCTFELPVQAVECARAIRQAGAALGMQVRAGVHTGEIEIIGDDIAGVGVHIAARVMSKAGAGEVVVSRTVVDLVTGSGIAFEDRGDHSLKGVPGEWRLFAVKG